MTGGTAISYSVELFDWSKVKYQWNTKRVPFLITLHENHLDVVRGLSNLNEVRQQRELN